MIDSPNSLEGPGELEALIRASGDLVQVSDDLRPRVLEAAHVSSQWRLFQELLQQAAMLLLLAGATSALAMNGWQDRGRTHHNSGVNRLDTMATPSKVPAMPGDHGWSSDPGWKLVESFAEIRRRQAELLPRGA